MSAQNVQPGPPSTEPRNILGVVGFVASIVGLISCGTLSPIALLICLVALMKPPKGFATLGAVISLLGCLLFAFWGLTLVRTVMGAAAVGRSLAGSTVTFATLIQSRDAIAAEKAAAGGKLPDDTKAASIVGAYKDAWTRPLRYQRMGDTYRVVSDGADATAGTVDDVFLSETATEPETGIPR